MMQSRRREHGSSGELDVFRATSYFAAGLPPPAPDDDCHRPSSATELSYFQAKVVHHDTRRMATEGNSFHGQHQQQLAGLHGHAECHDNNKQLLQVVAAKRQQQASGSGKSKLAALLSFMVSPSPSPRASFRKDEKKQEAPSSTRLRQAEAAASAAAGGEKETAANNTYKAANSRSSSSRESSGMQLQGMFGAHNDDDELDLGVATGDRRLQGITVVRSIGGGDEKWVVRCVPGGAWDEEEHREKMLDVDASAESASSEQNSKDEELLVEVDQRHDDDGNIDTAHSWDSDSSSDLFDLDLEYR